jgi:hypothetical protein
MTGADFVRVAATLGISVRQLSIRLGLSDNTGHAYATNRTTIPLYITFACTTIVHRLTPYPN